jgi:dTDP-4-amino-4,6-dideoxygalactose transaminase
VHQLSGYREALGPQECGSVPVTDQVATELLSLPMYPALSTASVDIVATALRSLAVRPVHVPSRLQ